jgi:hypothetical protein
MVMEIVQVLLLFSASLFAWVAVTLGLLMRFWLRGGVLHVKSPNGERKTFPSAAARRQIRKQLARKQANGATV